MTYNEICIIVENMDEKFYEKLCNFTNDYFYRDGKTKKNGYSKLKYHLKKFGITVPEWMAWCYDEEI